MSPRPQERIGIIGLGAIGGSLALALRERATVVGWSDDPADRAAAQRAGIRVCGERGSTWADDIATATAVVIAVPLNEAAAVARELLPRLPDEALVVHTGSLHRREALGLSERESRRVLGTHPIAGSERFGFGAADAAMFRGATLRAEARATEAERQRIERLWRAAGIERIAWGDASTHDALMSWVSHLPQLTATALSAVLQQRGVTASDAGGGAHDTTRLASSAFQMWAPILRGAPDETVQAVRSLASTLNALADGIERRDSASIAAVWEQALAWRAPEERLA